MQNPDILGDQMQKFRPYHDQMVQVNDDIKHGRTSTAIARINSIFADRMRDAETPQEAAEVLAMRDKTLKSAAQAVRRGTEIELPHDPAFDNM
jgi:hypothetical protein